MYEEMELVLKHIGGPPVIIPAKTITHTRAITTHTPINMGQGHTRGVLVELHTGKVVPALHRVATIGVAGLPEVELFGIHIAGVGEDKSTVRTSFSGVLFLSNPPDFSGLLVCLFLLICQVIEQTVEVNQPLSASHNRLDFSFKCKLANEIRRNGTLGIQLLDVRRGLLQKAHTRQ